MLKNARGLSLDICDYNNNALCSLYDNTADVSGQATDVYVKTERNGWKELSFRLPATCLTAEGEEPNFRLKYLIADYRIRLQSQKPDSNEVETDWFLVSEPKISHDSDNKIYEVVADHISSLLKTKNLGLEFSDEEGNNVGTIQQIAKTILEGTGWYIQDPYYVFLEDKNVATSAQQEKVRSFVASAKTGAFKMMSDLCEKFDAKPVYHGEGTYLDSNGELQTGRTVEIVPMNPFSEVEGSEIPEEVMNGENVLELYYNRNVTSIHRTLDSRNLVTRLYAYGSYGDDTTGLCSMQNCEHKEYSFIITKNYPPKTELGFVDEDGARYYFTLSEYLIPNDVLIWSDLDPLSKSYIYNSKSDRISKIYKEQQTSNPDIITASAELVRNNFDYLMDFSYYESVNLLTDNMMSELVHFQREMPAIIENARTASRALINEETKLSEIGESNTGFLRLAVSGYSTGSQGELKLILNKSVYPDGIMYRSDYMEAKRNYFSWYCASQLKDNGDPVSGIGSVVYIVHDTDPQTWEKAYIKYIDDKAQTQEYGKIDSVDPSSITLWLTNDSRVPRWSDKDRFYLFCTNSNSGKLGVRESELESLERTLQNTTKIITEEHPTYFRWDNEDEPSTNNILTSYGWYYKSYINTMDRGDLYFCFGEKQETTWHPVLISDTAPAVVNGSYYFNLKAKTLFHGENGVWVQYEDLEGKRLATNFSKVIYYCLRHDMIYKGLYDTYTISGSNNLPAGNYAIQNDFGCYWVFSTTGLTGYTMYLDTTQNLVYQSARIEDVVKPEEKPFDVIDFPSSNILDTTWTYGTINRQNGTESNSTSLQRSNNITVYSNVEYKYNLPAGSFALFYNSKRRFISDLTLASEGVFTTTNDTKYVRFVIPNSIGAGNYLRVNNYENKLFVSDKEYTILQASGSGERKGIMYLIKAFADTADRCYLTYYPAYKTASDAITERNNNLALILGDLYREGYWQKNDYVEGDETKLYKDAVDNLVKIAKPEATYDINFIDLYNSNTHSGYTVDETGFNPEWPDIDITDAVHLVDDDIDVNCWAFIDKIEKCYDKPWQTKLTINTNLSLIGQKTFADVMTHIAEVANEAYGNQTLYKRAGALTGTGKLTADKLEGAIKANTVLINGGSSNWYTDEKGAIVLEAADGQSAMKLTGAGFAVASSKDQWGDWNWRTFGTGNGFTADEIITGEMSAVRLTAGSITVDQINASVGQELDIGSNKSLLLYSTVDGLRPAGSLRTKVATGDGVYRDVNEGDSYIYIAAKDESNPNDPQPAEIDIMTGGLLNLQGSTMNLAAQSTMNLNSSTMNIKSGSDMNISAGGSLNINVGNNNNEGKLIINSPNFKITENSNVTGGYKVEVTGRIESDEGKIAGFTLQEVDKGKQTHRQFLQAGGTDSLSSQAAGVYLGTDGINIGGGKFIFSANGQTAEMSVSASNIHLGTTTLQGSFDSIDNTITSNVNTLNDTITTNVNNLNDTIATNKAAAEADTANARAIANSKSKTFRCTSEQILTAKINGEQYKVGDTWTCTDVVKDANGNNVCYYYQYVCKQVSTPRNVKNDWTLTGTSVTAGAGLAIDATAGTIDIVAAEGITIASGGTVNIAANEKITIATKGTIDIGRGTKLFTIGSTGDKDTDNAYMYYNKTSITENTKPGIYIGTNGIRIGKGKEGTNNSETQYFTATAGGDVEISGSIKATTLTIAGTGISTYVDNKTNAAVSTLAGEVASTYLLKADHESFVSEYTTAYSGLTNQTKFLQSDGTIKLDAFTTGTDGTALGLLKRAGISIDNSGKIELSSMAETVVTSSGLTTTLGNYAKTTQIPGKISQLTWDTLGNSSKILLTPDAVTITTSGKFSLASTNFTVTNTGVITAKSGTIGGWQFNSSNLQKKVDPEGQNPGYYVGLDAGTPTNSAFWAGPSATNLPFRVTKAGKLYATDAIITGSVTATSGTFTGTIQSTSGYIGSFTIESALHTGDTTTGKIRRDAVPGKNNTYTCPSGVYIGSDGIGLGGVSSNVSNSTRSPFSVDNNGNLYAVSGTIGGWTLGTNWLGNGNTLAASSVGMHSSATTNNVVFWAGGTNRATAPFIVTYEGKLISTTADIKGTINATSGYIGGTDGWVITDKMIYKNAATPIYFGETSDYTYNDSKTQTGHRVCGIWFGRANPFHAPFGMFHDFTEGYTYLKATRLMWMNFKIDGSGKIDCNEISLASLWNSAGNGGWNVYTPPSS